MKKLLLYVFITLFIGGIPSISVITNNVYPSLVKPPLSPPGILFPIVWSILFILMGNMCFYGCMSIFSLFLKPENNYIMNRLSIFAMLTILAMAFCSCTSYSKQFKAMEEEILSIENKINEITDCDELQMMNFGILGLRSDLDNYKQEAAISDFEINKLGDMLDQLTAAWNGRWAAMDCDQGITGDELDTSGEEDVEYRDYNIL